MITNNGTVTTRIPAHKVPDGYVHDNVSAFSDYEGRFMEQNSPKVFSVERSSIADPDPLVTYAAIFNDPTVGLNKQIADYVTAQLPGITDDVEIWSMASDLSTNAVVEKNSELFKDDPIVFHIPVIIYFKTVTP